MSPTSHCWVRRIFLSHVATGAMAFGLVKVAVMRYEMVPLSNYNMMSTIILSLFRLDSWI
jgi:hypothetical protein